MMRTTIDLPSDVHALAREIAHQQRMTMSEVITECVRRGLGVTSDGSYRVDTDGPGLPTVTLGRLITAEDVRSLEDE